MLKGSADEKRLLKRPSERYVQRRYIGVFASFKSRSPAARLRKTRQRYACGLQGFFYPKFEVAFEGVLFERFRARPYLDEPPRPKRDL
jgi:hypothetical protein